MTDVDFVMRSNTWDKPGGDVHQVQEYIRHLKAHGVDGRIVEFRPGMSLRAGSIAHIVNIDRPFDYLEAVRVARGHVTYVSPIHHALGAVREMRLAERGQGLRSVVGRVLPEWAREWLAFVVRSSIDAHGVAEGVRNIPSFLRYVPSMPGVWRRVGRALDNSAGVFLLAEGEGQDISADTGWNGRNGQLVPNGVPDVPPTTVKWADRSSRILVAGRIEPRKRQLETAQAAARLGIGVDFVGPTSSTTDSYGEEFRELIGASSGLRWLGGMPHEELVAEMGRRRVLLNTSWVEVQSLVDLEASLSGCYVVAGAAGNSAEWLPESVTVCPTSHVDPMLLLANEKADEMEGPPAVTYDWSWARCAAALAKAYRG